MIGTVVPAGCAVRLLDLPCGVEAMVAVDEEGFASIYLNARQSYETQRRSLRHELEHLARDDMFNEKDITEVEGMNG